MSWLSGLAATGRPKRAASARVSALFQPAQGKPEKIQLRPRGREQEVALIALRVGRLMQLGARAAHLPPHVVAGRERAGAEVLRDLEQVPELDPLVAAHAGDRRSPGRIALGKVLDHLRPEALLEVEHVVRDVEVPGHLAGILDVLPGAAGALAPERLAMVVELEGDADHLEAGLDQQRRRAGAVDAARHRDHHATAGRQVLEPEPVAHARSLIRIIPVARPAVAPCRAAPATG